MFHLALTLTLTLTLTPTLTLRRLQAERFMRDNTAAADVPGLEYALQLGADAQCNPEVRASFRFRFERVRAKAQARVRAKVRARVRVRVSCMDELQ